MRKVGLTGGIGSGKSVVASIFLSLGIPVFNSDIEAARLMHASPAIKKALISLFGEEVYNEYGLNRAFLREKIFADDMARKQVNDIVHPAVRKTFMQFCEAHGEQPYVIQEAAILFESEGHKKLDAVIVVSAPEEMRISRVMERDGLTETMVRKIMSKQMPDKEKIARAGYVIYNNEEQLLIEQVYTIHEKLQKQR